MKFIVNRVITIFMLFLAFAVLGYISYRELKLELLPNAELPVLYVQVSSSKTMDPSYMENQAIIPIEGVISQLDGIESIESTANAGGGNIQIKLKKRTNLKYASIKLQEKINTISSSLPDGVKAIVQKGMDASMTSNFIMLQIRGDGGVDRIRNVFEEKGKSQLENIDGVASVNIYGGRQKAIEVCLDKEVCKAYGITPEQISNSIRNHTQSRTFVGNVSENQQKLYVHVNAEYEHIAELENIVVAANSILLKDVATIFFDFKEEVSYSRVNGQEAISCAITNDAQSNMIDLSHRIQEEIDSLNEELKPAGVEIFIQSNTADVMEKNLKEISWSAIVGGILAVIILWFFLKNLRLVIIIALSIPLSILTAFNIFYALGVSINSFSLVGMALAIGMLLDNSIVVLENIYRLSALGYSAEKAVVNGTREVWKSIFASTLTTITVFLPFVFSDNYLIQMLGYQIGVSIISTLCISLLVALLFVPMTTFLMLRSNKGNSVFYEKIAVTQRPTQIYLVLLKACMRNPFATSVGALVILIIVIAVNTTTSSSSVKTVKSNTIGIDLSTRMGSTLEETNSVISLYETRLMEIAEVKDVISNISENKASITVLLKDNFEKIGKRKISIIRDEMIQKIPYNRVTSIKTREAHSGDQSNGMMNGMSQMMRMLGAGGSQKGIRIKGNNYEMLQIVGDDLLYQVRNIDFISWSYLSTSGRQPELHLLFDGILLDSYGINKSNIGNGLMSMNRNFSSGTSIKIDDKDYDIIIRENVEKQEEEKDLKEKSIEELKQIQIVSNSGVIKEIDEIATVFKSQGVSTITRKNKEKEIGLFFGYKYEDKASKEILDDYNNKIKSIVANYNLPVGVAIEVIEEEDEFADFKFLIIAAFVLIFMILAAVFESVFTPFVLIFTIPLAAIGSLLALALSGNSLMNANALTGFLILLGVVVNNGIILIDYSNILRHRGVSRNRALILAGVSRMRPILITSVTTIVAMLPIAMGDTEYAGIIGAPFAITVIGGLACSALLTLIMIPTVCVGLENTLKWYSTLKKSTYILHGVIFLFAIWYIYLRVSGLFYQCVALFVVILLIPGTTYFIMNSLRKANEKLINPEDSILIRVENLVKVYDRPSLFIRQWYSGVALRKRLGLHNEYHSKWDFVKGSWQYAIAAFVFYLNCFFLESTFWILSFSIILYVMVMHFLKQISNYRYYKSLNNKWQNRLVKLCKWTLPLVFCLLFGYKADSTGLIVFVLILWYLSLAVIKTSDYLYSNNINIERLTGRFAGIRRNYYKIVKSVPVLGKKHIPFKALRGVSFEIKTGMFGLLGPNGAGKSTFMRIICGILEQSYGTIFINEFNTKEYREELQGLIGFLPQEFGMYENMSAWDFLDYEAILKGITDPETRMNRLDYVLKAVHMFDKKDKKIGSFSGGMKQRIGIALILLNLPRILVVDEPTAGLDPRERIRFRNLLVELSRDRIVIFSTHIIEDISSSCNQVAIINKGSLGYFGNPKDMVHFATNKVWLFTISVEEFETKLDTSLVVHHIQDNDLIKVRYISIESPYEGAVRVEPNLEDAYLCMLKNI